MTSMKTLLCLLLAPLFSLASNQATHSMPKPISKLTYDCYGDSFTAIVQIDFLRVDSKYHSENLYNAKSELAYSNGDRLVTRVNKSWPTPYRDLIPFGHGAYNNNKTVSVYRVSGKNLQVTDLNHSLYIEIDKNDPSRAALYLGHRDARQDIFSPAIKERYNAGCVRR